MLIQILVLRDEATIMDVVGLSDFKHADKVEQELGAQFGRQNVYRSSVIVDELPEFWGLVPPESRPTPVAADPPCSHCGNIGTADAFTNFWRPNTVQRTTPLVRLEQVALIHMQKDMLQQLEKIRTALTARLKPGR
jgi:hypothetical protein